MSNVTPTQSNPTVQLQNNQGKTSQGNTGFSDAMQNIGNGLAGASSMVTGGGFVSAAVNGALGGAGGNNPLQSAHSTMMDDNMEFLQIQQQIQSENRQFSTLSNVLKARHETAKNAIGNIR